MKYRAILLLLSTPLLACTTKTTRANGELKVDPVTVDFGDACVAAPGVDPAVRTVTLQNVGFSALGVTSISIENDPSKLFTLPTSLPTDLAAGDKKPIDITFLPTAKGFVTAQLLAKDDSGVEVKATLQGNGADLPPNPILDIISCEKKQGTGVAIEPGCPTKYITFPDTFLNQSNTLKVVIQNKGCPSLKISRIGIDPPTLTRPEVPFAVASPAPPSAASPLVISGASKPTPTTLEVRFTPHTDQYSWLGYLTLESNDPANPVLKINLQGNGVQPSLTLFPTACDYSNAADICGSTGAKDVNKAFFNVRNSGSASLTISDVHMQNGNAHFAVSGLAAGQALAAGAQANFTIAFDHPASFEKDTLVIVSNGGTATANLQGGFPPQIDTVPQTTLDFNTVVGSMPTGVQTCAPLIIKEVGGQSPLTISGVSFDPNSNQGGHFSLTPFPNEPPACAQNPAPAPGTKIAPNGQLTMNVHFKDPPSGAPNSVFANLLIASDALGYPSPPGYLVTLQAKTPCHLSPVANVSGPVSASLGTTPKVTFSGAGSYALTPDATGQCTIQSPSLAKYTWTLVQAPASAANAKVCAAGSTTNCQPKGSALAITTGAQADLVFDTQGQYTVQLVVTDATGLDSPAASAAINVSP